MKWTLYETRDALTSTMDNNNGSKDYKSFRSQMTTFVKSCESHLYKILNSTALTSKNKRVVRDIIKQAVVSMKAVAPSYITKFPQVASLTTRATVINALNWVTTICIDCQNEIKSKIKTLEGL